MTRGLGIANLDDFTLIPQAIKAPGSGATQDELKKYLEGHQYSDELTVPDDEGILSLDGLIIGSRGNIVAINGRAKSRKSVIAAAMVSACFSNSFLGFSTEFPRDPKVLHFDTEQGYGDWLEGCHRMITDAGLRSKPAGFISHHSRDCTVEMRLDLLRYALDIYQPDVLVIDGVTDLVYDLNSQEEATKVGGELMAWSVKYNCLIIVIIHLTKGNGYMTGALGTYLEKKCQTAIKCELDEDNPEEISNISCQYARRRPFRPFGIRYNDQAKQYERTDPTKEITKSVPPGKTSDEIKTRLINQTFNLCSAPANEHELKKWISKAADIIGLAQQMTPKDLKAWVSYWRENQLIAPDPDGKILRVERLELLKKAMPSLDFSAPENGVDHAPEHDPDDLPF